MILDTRQLIRIKPCFYYNQIYDSTFSMNMHKHNTLEIMYVTVGDMTVEFMDENGAKESAKIMQGQFVLIKPNLTHKILFTQKTTSNILNVEFECRSPLLKIENIFFANGLTATFPQSAQLHANFKDILIFNDTCNFLQAINNLQEMLKLDFSEQQFELVYSLNISQLLINLTLCEQIKSQYNEGNIYINKAVMYMQKNMHKNINLQDISNATGCSAAYLEKIFKKHYSVTVNKKLNEFRIQKAKHMLKDFSSLIKDIGKTVGFSNTQSFINNFKEITGLTPNEYRHKERLEYKNIHAYEKSSFDEKFNNFLTFDKGIMIMGQPLTEFVNDEYANSYLCEIGETITGRNAAEIKNKHKFLFVNVSEDSDLKTLLDFSDALTKKNLFDNFIGFYIRGENSEKILEKIKLIHRFSPYKRILADIKSYPPPREIVLAATDIILTEDELRLWQENNDVNVWLKQKYSESSLTDSQSHAFPNNFGGIIYTP